MSTLNKTGLFCSKVRCQELVISTILILKTRDKPSNANQLNCCEF